MLVAGRVARALSRGSHLEVREQHDDYTKEAGVGNKDIQRAGFQLAHAHRELEQWMSGNLRKMLLRAFRG